MRDSIFKMLAVASATTALLAACGGGDDPAPPLPTPVPVGDTVALTAGGSLISFNRTTPGTLVGSQAVSNLNANETLLGIDYRPADGLLYGVGSAGNLYTIEPSTGVATFKVALKALAGDTDPFTTLVGTEFGVDFNPAADRLRVVSNAGQNLRINVATGDTTTDTVISLAGGTASVTAAGYTNAFFGTSTTQLFDIDAASGLLHLQDPPNNGTLAVGLPLTVTGTQVNGFDIDARTNTGYAALTVGGTTNLYTVNIGTGAAASVGAIAGGQAIRGLALKQPATPTVLGLTDANALVAFDPKAPNTITATLPITGLGAGETVVGIDVRPQDGLLYALTGAGKLYTVNTTTGQATFTFALTANPTDNIDGNAPFTALSGTVFSVDFNPAANRLRVVSNTGQNLRIDVTNGLTFTDLDINRAGVAPTVLASAYTNSFVGGIPGTASTQLFNLEANSDVLTLQAPPNNGTLTNVGTGLGMGIDITGTAAFDIAGGANGLALAALRTGTSGPFTLYSVNLTTGVAALYTNAAANIPTPTNGTAPLNQIGGTTGPALLDIAIRF